MIKVHGVNGIFTPNQTPNHNTDFLLYTLQSKYNVPIWDFKYPFTDALMTYSLDDEIDNAKLLMANMSPGDSVFAHSRGARIVYRACLMGAKFTNIYLLSAAARRNIHFPDDCVSGKIINFFNPKDRVLNFTLLLPFNPMGRLGKLGQYRTHPNMIDINAYPMMTVHGFGGHTDYFECKNVDAFASYIAKTYNKPIES